MKIELSDVCHQIFLFNYFIVFAAFIQCHGVYNSSEHSADLNLTDTVLMSQLCLIVLAG